MNEQSLEKALTLKKKKKKKEISLTRICYEIGKVH